LGFDVENAEGGDADAPRVGAGDVGGAWEGVPLAELLAKDGTD